MRIHAALLLGELTPSLGLFVALVIWQGMGSMNWSLPARTVRAGLLAISVSLQSNVGWADEREAPVDAECGDGVRWITAWRGLPLGFGTQLVSRTERERALLAHPDAFWVLPAPHACLRRPGRTRRDRARPGGVPATSAWGWRHTDGAARAELHGTHPTCGTAHRGDKMAQPDVESADAGAPGAAKAKRDVRGPSCPPPLPRDGKSRRRCAASPSRCSGPAPCPRCEHRPTKGTVHCHRLL